MISLNWSDPNIEIDSPVSSWIFFTSTALTSFVSSPLVLLLPLASLDDGKPCAHPLWQFLVAAVTRAVGTDHAQEESPAWHEPSPVLRGQLSMATVCNSSAQSLKFCSPHYCLGHRLSICRKFPNIFFIVYFAFVLWGWRASPQHT